MLTAASAMGLPPSAAGTVPATLPPPCWAAAGTVATRARTSVRSHVRGAQGMGDLGWLQSGAGSPPGPRNGSAGRNGPNIRPGAAGVSRKPAHQGLLRGTVCVAHDLLTSPTRGPPYNRQSIRDFGGSALGGGPARRPIIRRRTRMKNWSLVAPLALLAGCSQGGQVAARIPADSSQYFRAQVEQLTTVAAAKDRLVRDLAETTKLVADINSEILTVSKKEKAVEPVVGSEVNRDERQMVLKRVQDLTSRLKSSETRLASTQRRLRALTGESDSLKRTLADMQSTIDGLQATIESQKNTMATK